eukprot:gb/GFBE01013739.1/.p1 GENE.gb/GFBE01013739.1/~~gb/GFBE01013739.1/.p1  ORF type:complete len:907 (+),score=157.69 gb/GFBE01013739.1/:1-2721(+)
MSRMLLLASIATFVVAGASGETDYACRTDLDYGSVAAVTAKGIAVDDSSLRWCPGQFPKLWPNTGHAMTSLRLFKAWSPEWPEDNRPMAFEKLKEFVVANNAKVLVGTPVSCSESDDDVMWAWTKELLHALGPQHVMGLAIGNELEILQFKDSIPATCVKRIWDGGYFWQRFEQTVSDLDQMGFQSVPITSVFTGYAMVGSPFFEEPGKGLVNSFLKNATAKFGRRFVWTWNLYPYFDPNLHPDKGTEDQCNDALAHTSCWHTECNVPITLRLARNKMHELTGNHDDTLWLGETGWSTPMSDSLKTRMKPCEAWSSRDTFENFYKGFLSWDLEIGGGMRPPDHAFWFTLRDSINFGSWEHFGLIEACNEPRCKLHAEGFDAAGYKLFHATSNRYCGNPALFDEFSQGEHDCRNRCTLHPDCKFYSHWQTNWCRLTSECSWTVPFGDHAITIHEQLYVAPPPTPAATTVTTTSTQEQLGPVDTYRMFQEPSNRYCADNPHLFEGFSAGHDDCRGKCTEDAACKYYSHWDTNWCRLTTTCTSTEPLGTHAIVIFEKIEPVFHYELVDEPSNRYCADNPALFEDFSEGSEDCRQKCSLDSTCGYYSVWETNWCRLTASCASTAPLGTHIISIYRKQLAPGTTEELQFMPVDGGSNRACRGASVTDNLASYFTVFSGTASLDECQEHCRQAAACVGIEHNAKALRCEVWTRPAGIGVTKEADGYTCMRALRREEHSVKEFLPAGGGTDRACRGATATDNKNSYFIVHSSTVSIDACKRHCTEDKRCQGIEYNAAGKRCEIWIREGGVGATNAVSGYVCLHAVSADAFALLDGEGRACRGEHSADKRASYFTVAQVDSLSFCKARCVDASECQGISFSGSRCEVWTRPEGIDAARGHQCDVSGWGHELLSF